MSLNSHLLQQLGTMDGFAQLFESDMFKPLQEVIEAYIPRGTEEEELNALLDRKLIWPFLECRGTSTCQRLGRANWGVHSSK